MDTAVMVTGSSPPQVIVIPLHKGGRGGKEIEDDIKDEFEALGYVWFTDYYIERTADKLTLAAYNKDLAKHIPQTIIGDLI